MTNEKQKLHLNAKPFNKSVGEGLGEGGNERTDTYKNF